MTHVINILPAHPGPRALGSKHKSYQEGKGKLLAAPTASHSQAAKTTQTAPTPTTLHLGRNFSNSGGSPSLGPATTQNLVVQSDGEICGGVLVENASDDFPQQKKLEISFQTSPEVRHQFRRKLRQLHSGNRWCLHLSDPTEIPPPIARQG